MERWREIPGFDGVYSISDRGRVRNTTNGNILRPNAGSDGPLTINLYHWTSPKQAHAVADLVKAAFGEPGPRQAQTIDEVGEKRRAAARRDRAIARAREDLEGRLRSARALG